MPVTVACVVMTGESRDRDAAVTIAGGFSGAAVPAHSASATSSYRDACAVRPLGPGGEVGESSACSSGGSSGGSGYAAAVAM